MRVAALQFCPVLMDKKRNIDTVAAYLDSCSAELAVLPELATTGYFFGSASELRSVAEPADGPACTLIRGIAERRSMAVCAGFAELDGERCYNSAILALPGGRSFIYRKTHLFGLESTMFTPGDSGFFVVDHAGVRIGMMICYDWRFPESARTLALRGAQIICHPSDLVALPTLWQPVMRVRSVENRVFTITADRTGTETVNGESLTFHGGSQITAVNGSVLAGADETFEGWIEADIDPADADRKSFSPHNDIFRDRRPEMYER
jgi:predicted amidohydrolase